MLTGGIENSASHLRAVASRLIASDRKWPTSGSQARRLVRKTRRLSGRSHDLYRGYFRVYRTCCGMMIITVRLTQALENNIRWCTDGSDPGRGPWIVYLLIGWEPCV